MKKMLNQIGKICLAAGLLIPGAVELGLSQANAEASTNAKTEAKVRVTEAITEAITEAKVSAVAAPAPQTNQPVKVLLKGKPLKQQGLQGEEGALLPFELIRKDLKIPVKHNEKTNVYTLKRQNVIVELKPTENGAKATVNGSDQVLPYEWKVVGGKPYVSAKVLTDHLGYTSEWDQAKGTLNLIPHKLNNIKISTRVIDKTIPGATIKLQYPHVSGLKSKEAERKINAELQSRADAFVQQSLKDTQNNQPSPNGSPFEFIGNYTVTFNRDGLLSILEQTYAYTGGAHGMSFREGLTFRLSDGKLLTLDEVLSANPGFRSIVDPSIAKQLEQTEGYFGGFKTIGNNPDYYLKDNGVVIFFQLYDYLPYVFGFPEFYFSFQELGVGK